MAKPVIVVVDDEDASLQALTLELESRYGAHYQVVTGSSAEAALTRHLFRLPRYRPSEAGIVRHNDSARPALTDVSIRLQDHGRSITGT